MHSVHTVPTIALSAHSADDFIPDYMDDGWPSAFGQICGETVEDDCLYINSHLNSLGILNYADDISCMVQLNAGNRQGAR